MLGLVVMGLFWDWDWDWDRRLKCLARLPYLWIFFFWNWDIPGFVLEFKN